MSEWIERPLSSLGRYVNGFAFKPHHWGKEGLPIVRIEQLNNPDGRYDFCSTHVPADNIIDDGDLIFSWSATLKVAIWRHGRAALNQHLFKVVPYPDTDKEFLFQLLDHHMEALAGGAHGSTMRHIKRSELDKFIVPVPGRIEQSMLGRILRALDTQIEATEALIAKQERIRAGMMQDLFTRGVDEHGQLRLTRDLAPYLYHRTELGWLPIGWKSLALSEACALIRDGTHLPPPRTEAGPLLLSVRNMVDGGFALTGSDDRVPESFFNMMHRTWRIKSGDTLLAIVGATIGKTCQVPSDFPTFTLQRSVCVLRGETGVLEPDFLALLIQREEFNVALWSRANQTAQPGVYLDQIGKILTRVPPIPEQQRICAVVQTASQPITLLKSDLSKLRLQKSGLMQDLLTGEVSVAPLIESAA